MRIYKYPIPPPPGEGLLAVQMPRYARVLSVHLQGEQPCIYAVVDPNEPMVYRLLMIYATGQDMGAVGPVVLSTWAFVGTFILSNGDELHIWDTRVEP